MDTLLKAHNNLEFLHTVHGFADKISAGAIVYIDDNSTKDVLNWPYGRLLLCNDGVTIHVGLVIDATFFLRCLVQYDKPYKLYPRISSSLGDVRTEIESHPFDVNNKMVFMDWKDSHVNGNKEVKGRNKSIATFPYVIPFLSKTSLVARPGLPMRDIKERMVVRMDHLGIIVKSIDEDEHCVIPMGGNSFLSYLLELLVFGLSFFSHASNNPRLEVMAKGTVPLVNMATNLLQDRE
ncbi:hypothetical protein BUALT_BualtUnG0048400 [Buddleja alternifolia]|uniref:Uncharacterized protein n=1 Tax=Buddleja alternifolia TaxID=168488 RepID=A0AAV6W088_9LAMI|nr:hypothetical protein BUALT_BualtUnG0048400 [Buddleja alternifolia]